jgi:hypothetical protein
MQVITETELLERINAFRASHDDMAPTTFGRKATGNANLIKELEDGKSPSLRTVQRIVDFMGQADAEARLRAKLEAPPPEPREEQALDLPFVQAPGTRPGASSPTCSPTSAPQRPLPASASSRCSGSEG